MSRLTLVWIVLGLMSCKRVVATAPQGPACSPALCGGTVSVTTQLAPGTELTAAECTDVCASAWCGAKPITRAAGSVGCRLTSANTVSCDAVAYDCGYCVGGCGTSCGAGCCDSTSNCCVSAARPECARGSTCSACPAPDARCSMANCASFKSCGGALDTEPDPGACANADGGVDSTLDLATFCPDACNAKHAGALVEQCPGDAGVVDAGVDAGGCVEACGAERATCVEQCSRASFGECMQCSALCGVRFGQCRRACP